ncbi:CLUMA_CG008706, isoform B [Clunio marinus]|uniref:CLUMA_CG008706, isoform B n=1 Tax=Clunio marinus TaxID=568069 RepID=A0A1J1I8J1_9DIPT|nr:CLUMA_CG008706, isoform B [Clunio marinus]
MTENGALLNDEISNDEQQLIKLSLKKPKMWNWELTTSKSSSNIAFPTIELYDENRNTLLAKAKEAGCIVGSKLRKSASVSRASSLHSVRSKDSYRVKIRNDSLIGEILKQPVITEPEEYKENDRSESTQIHFRHNTSSRSASEKEYKKSNEKPRTKPYSRSSSNSMRSRSSVSILERISELRRSSSSEESEEEEPSSAREKQKHKYSYRSCPLGTIIVPKVDLTNARRRPKKREESSDKLIALRSSSSGTNLRQPSTARIIDSQDIKNVTSDSNRFLDDSKSVNPDEVFLLLVKRLASLHYNQAELPHDSSNFKSLVSSSGVETANQHSLKDGSSSFQTINNCRSERANNTNRRSKTPVEADYDEVDFQSTFDCNYKEQINETINKSARTQKNMGSNVSTAGGKGLSGRRTQSSSNIDNNKSSITNGICCSTNSKYNAKSGRKNSNHSQDCDKKPLNNNNINNNNSKSNRNEQFDGIDQIISCSNVNTGTLKQPKKSKSTSKDRKKLHGSLPNHLDTDVDYEGSDDTNSSAYGNRVKFQSVNKIITPNPPVQVIDQCYDQGYGSERSPEDEIPPPLPILDVEQQYNPMIVNSVMMSQGFVGDSKEMLEMEVQQRLHQQAIQQNYDFISEDCTFNVEIIKGPRGLGLSVSGGIDSNAPYPGLVRIKRLFPHQAAWATGKLQPGDILLEANGIILTGLTNNEALEVLRTMANDVNLLVCRPHDEHFRKLSPPTAEPPIPPMRSSFNFKHQQYMNQLESILPPGEFEITLVKQQGSLGFTLQKEDESVVGHYVRALVREPATTDGRINAGDKIVAVNDIQITNMTHEQAVIFLRQAPDTVKLRLYRDDGQTSLATTSPSDSDYKSYAGTSTLKRTKVNLRPEAINLLSDLASKKNTQSSSDGNSASSSFQSSLNTASSPRRLRKNNIKCSITSAQDSEANNSSDSTLKSNTSMCSNPNNQTYIISEGTSSGTMTPYSDSSADTLTVISQAQRMQYYDPHELVRIIPDDDDGEGYYDSDELEKLEHDGESQEGQLKRPEHLNLDTQSGSTPVASRKPLYQFTIATANAYELNNLDNAVLDAPTSYNMGINGGGGDNTNDGDTFTSLPCETLLLACKTENDLKKSLNDEDDTDTCLYVTKFNKNQPLYQSAQVQINHKQSNDVVDGAYGGGGGDLLKWKGGTMSNDDDDKCSVVSSQAGDNSPMPSIQRISIRNAQKDLNLDEMGIDCKEFKIITIEMNRRWSCRLGIRLESQLASKDSLKSITVIKEICKDTLAERDGRLVSGDRVLMINDEIVDARPTQEIIEMMRIIRGPLCITVARKIES